MPPIFTWYHLSSDELLGSWLFLIGTLPLIPYCLLYCQAAPSGGEKLLSFIALAIGVFFCLGALLFVYASYPSDKDRQPYLQPIFSHPYCICRCCSTEWIARHFANDWLAGCWFILWGTVVTTFLCLIFFLIAAGEADSLDLFVYGTALVDNTIFLIGSAYFVAGSYPVEGLYTNLLNEDTIVDTIDNGMHRTSNGADSI